MRQEIVYNRVNIFSGQAIPFLAKNSDYIQAGERWAQKESWVMNGFLTGCDFTSIKTRKDSLLSNFNQLVGSIDIGTGISFDIIYIDDINIEESDYIGYLPYSITFSTYPSGQTQEFGVIEPSDQISYTENTDKTMTMVRSIKAKGYPIEEEFESQMMGRLKNFVEERKNTSVMKPFIITTTGTNLAYYLESSEESIDRINHTYSVTQTFKTDLDSSQGNVINRYTIEQSQRIYEMDVVSYKGQIDAGKYGTLSSIRAKYAAFRNSITSLFLLDERVTEDKYINRLTYDFSFYSGANANNFPQILDDFSIEINETSSSSLFNMNVNGNISVNYGCLEDRWGLVSGYYNGFSSITPHWAKMITIYNSFYADAANSKQSNPGVILNKTPLTLNHSKNQLGNTISYSVSFNDRYIPKQLEGDRSTELSISKSLAIDKKAIKEHYLGGKYICQDLGINQRSRVAATISREGAESQETGICAVLANPISYLENDASIIYQEPITDSYSEYTKTETLSVGKSYHTEEVFELP